MAPQTALTHNVTDIHQHIPAHIRLGSTYLMQPKARKTTHNLHKDKYGEYYYQRSEFCFYDIVVNFVRCAPEEWSSMI